MDTEAIIATTSYFGIFALMAANGFFSFPSSQALYIIAGFFVSKGDLSFAGVVFSGALGNTIGNIFLYEVARAKGMEYLLKFHVFEKREMEAANAVFQKRGAWFLAIGKLTPALKVFIPIPAGLAKMNRALFVAIIAATSAVWALPFMFIGFWFGKSAKVWKNYAAVMLVIAFAVLAAFYSFLKKEEKAATSGERS